MNVIRQSRKGSGSLLNCFFKKSGVLGCKEPQSNSQLESRVARSTYVSPGISDSPFPFHGYCSFVGILDSPWFFTKNTRFVDSFTERGLREKRSADSLCDCVVHIEQISTSSLEKKNTLSSPETN